MWITIFSFFLGIALGVAWAGFFLDAGANAPRPYGRRSARNLRPVRNS